MLLQRIAETELFSPLRDMQRLQNSLNRLLTAGVPAQPAEFPLVNVWTSDGGAVVRAEIPGVSPDDVDISLVNDTLTIKGSRRTEEVKEGQCCQRQECGYGQFARSLQLPFAIEADQVEARFSNGVLQITLPRAEANKPRKISVMSE